MLFFVGQVRDIAGVLLTPHTLVLDRVLVKKFCIIQDLLVNARADHVDVLFFVLERRFDPL